MYKVFIQNKPLFFISTKEIEHVSGFFIRDGLALSDKSLIINTLKYLPKNLPLYVTCESPLESFQLFFNEHEKIEAAGGIVERKNKILFIKRNGVWDIPKGKLEKNETPEIGAIREIEEECGIIGPIITKPLTITYHTYEFQGKPTLKKTYWFLLNYSGTKTVKAQKEEGISKVIWKNKHKLTSILNNTYASIADVIEKYQEEQIIISEEIK